MKQKIRNSTVDKRTIPWGRIFIALGLVASYVGTFTLANVFTFQVLSYPAEEIGSMNVVTSGNIVLEAIFSGANFVLSIMAPLVIMFMFSIMPEKKMRFLALCVVALAAVIVSVFQMLGHAGKDYNEQKSVSQGICEVTALGSDLKHGTGTNTATCSLKTVDTETGEPVMQRSTYDFERSDNRDGLPENERTWNY